MKPNYFFEVNNKIDKHPSRLVERKKLKHVKQNGVITVDNQRMIKVLLLGNEEVNEKQWEKADNLQNNIFELIKKLRS